MIPRRTRLYLCTPGATAFHASFGFAEIDSGVKVTEAKISDADIPVWRQMLKVMSIELDLREELAAQLKGPTTEGTENTEIEEGTPP
jgi:hypothetical protein